MSRLSRLFRPGWLTLGLVLGAVVVPTVAVAATFTVVHISNGAHTAGVSAAGQLRTTAMDPAFNAHLTGSGGSNSCKNLGPAAPASRAYVVTNLSVSNITTPPANDYVSASVYVGAGCGVGKEIADIEFDAPGTHEVDLGNGVGVPANTPLSLSVNGGSVTLHTYGYTAAASAVPN